MPPFLNDPFPLLDGPDDVIEGYYKLESVERAVAKRTILDHRVAVTLWYRGLTLYRRGMLGTWTYDVTDAPQELVVQGLQSLLAGLGLSSAKASLDALLVGYYSAAYASIRHMLETWVQIHYLSAKPEDAMRWYRDPEQPPGQGRSPRMADMVVAIKANLLSEDEADEVSEKIISNIKKSWDLMSKGSHPTGEGITQTVAVDGVGSFVFGALHKPRMALIGFDQGLNAVAMLLRGLSWLRPQDVEWEKAAVQWDNDVSNWRNEAERELSEPI